MIYATASHTLASASVIFTTSTEIGAISTTMQPHIEGVDGARRNKEYSAFLYGISWSPDLCEIFHDGRTKATWSAHSILTKRKSSVAGLEAKRQFFVNTHVFTALISTRVEMQCPREYPMKGISKVHAKQLLIL